MLDEVCGIVGVPIAEPVSQIEVQGGQENVLFRRWRISDKKRIGI